MSAHVHTAAFGDLPISTARKAGRCEYGRRVTAGPFCRNEIKPGDQYAQGELSENAGGYARQRWCMECVATLAKAEGKSS